MKILSIPIQNYNFKNYSSNFSIGHNQRSISQSNYLNRDYLLRKVQNKSNYNKCTQFSQQRLEDRCYREILKEAVKETKRKKECQIKKSFSRKLKSNRWKKRHHQNV